jgi:hypothetical protein
MCPIINRCIDTNILARYTVVVVEFKIHIFHQFRKIERNLCITKHRKRMEVMKLYPSGFGGLVVSVLASGSRVRVFEPGRSRRIFSVCKKSTATPSFGGEVK